MWIIHLIYTLGNSYIRNFEELISLKIMKNYNKKFKLAKNEFSFIKGTG